MMKLIVVHVFGFSVHNAGLDLITVGDRLKWKWGFYN